MEDKNLKLFKKIIKLNQKELHYYVKNVLKKFGYTEIYEKKDSYLYAIGDIPVALIAHLDTVFKTTPKEIYFDSDVKAFWSPQGLGADDRAGVFAIFKILKMGYKPTIIFTHDEEMGALGACELIKDYPYSKEYLKYLIQLDRHGVDDAVFYDCANEDFIKYVEKFGFKEQIGSFSDISFIAPSWGVAAVNLSVGYIREHTTNETLFFNILLLTIKKVVNMLNDIHKADSFKYIMAQNAFYTFDSVKCDYCGKYHDILDVIPVVDGDKVYNFCLDCLAMANVSWCEECGQAFIGGGKKCNICQNKKK